MFGQVVEGYGLDFGTQSFSLVFWGGSDDDRFHEIFNSVCGGAVTRIESAEGKIISYRSPILDFSGDMLDEHKEIKRGERFWPQVKEISEKEGRCDIVGCKGGFEVSFEFVPCLECNRQRSEPLVAGGEVRPGEVESGPRNSEALFIKILNRLGTSVNGGFDIRDEIANG